MPETRYNLLTEPLIGVERAGERAGATLPEVLAGLGSRTIDEFTAIQPHQQHGWHAFLVQLAAIAVHRAGDGVVERDAASWAELLRGLTGSDDAWCLVVEDLSRPAFMQPPVPEGKLDALKSTTACPDVLDILATAKNHDVKRQRIGRPRPEHWVYALVSLQTLQGYSGRDNYGISRMNGGLSNRPCLSFAPDGQWATRFVRDTRVWLDSRDGLVERHGYAADEGNAILWIESWDGSTEIHLQSCDPFFIEVCRRVRLVDQGRVVACMGPSKAARVTGAVLGDTGDVWTPVDKEGKALTASRVTLSYRKLHELLLGDGFVSGAAQCLRDDDGPSPVFIGRVYVRGQGKSEGLHERELPIPPKVRGFFGSAAGRSTLGAMARGRVETVTTVANRILKVALCALSQGGADKLRLDDRRMDRWVQALDAEVDAAFFEHLFASVDQDPASGNTAWARCVLDLAREVLREAERSVPIPSMRRHKAVAAAWSYFEGGARKHFPDLYVLDGGANGRQ